VNLPAEIDKARRQIETYAREYGLDFYDVVFELLDFDQLNEVASYGGFPTRYPHWRFGMDYEELSKSYSYGLSKIYELVINNNPVYAYLMKSNASVEQKLVMAHVFGHADFFKNNLWFSKTNRRMIDEMANHATRVRHHIDRHGVEMVEDFIDACLSLENLIDTHSEFIERQERREHPPLAPPDDREEPEAVPKLKSKGYMDRYINPPAFLEEQKARIAEKAKRKKRVPEEPQRDALQFLLDHAPLENWERDILGIVREEAYYFAPQGMTKVMNEGWACLQGDALVFSDKGLLPIRDVVAGAASAVSDGERCRRTYDRHVIRDHATITVRTRRGLELCGSDNHRVLLADRRTWRSLGELRPGDRVAVAGGGGLWPRREVALAWRPQGRVTLGEVAASAGVSLWTVLRFRAGRSIQKTEAVAAALQAYDDPENNEAPFLKLRKLVDVPESLDPRLGAFLGYLVGDGHVSRVKRHLGLTTGDESQAVRFLTLGRGLFGVAASMRRDGGRWRILLHSETVSDFLVQQLGLTVGKSAREKRVPEAVLRSPEPVVREFLRAYFDCDAYAGKHGVILSTASHALAAQTQLLLLNYGILSRRRKQKDGCWHVQIMGASAARFAEKVGFGLTRKQKALEDYALGHRWFKDESWDDEVVSLEPGRADVYDISVEASHRYAAGGLVNHNSYWHSTIMTQRAMNDADVIDFADHHSGTLAMGPGRMNPYKIGIELFREIEDRWNKGKFGKEYDDCDDLEVRRRWDRKLGLGRQKIFEVRRIYNDVMFIDAFLTEEFCERLKLYVYGWDSRAGKHTIVSRDWRKVKQRFLFSLTNLGHPIIHVTEANYANRGELYLLHRYEGIPLDVEKARDTLKNLHRLWRRPVHLETMDDDRGRLLSYDGTEHKTARI
jgi:stage V sporulation protein R